MFLPTTPHEILALGWTGLDVILVSGDTYIDSAFSGVALLGKLLLKAGYKVGIIAQPDINNPEDIIRLGEPALFWGVSAGTVDSMVANTTALAKPRKMDDHTPGGINNRRPNRATIAYTNLIRRYFKNTVPIVLGGVEASLRRVAHYDYWSNSLRRSVLIDAKADYLLYGMADKSVLELAEVLKAGGDPSGLRGLCYLSHQMPEGYLELPNFEKVSADKQAFTQMFHIFYENNDPISASGLAQAYGDRYVVQNPPASVLTTEEMDEVYSLQFENKAHPYYAAQGEIRALQTIRNAIVTHRGCYGECNFCAIAVHEGRRVSWRSEESILEEARQLGKTPGFNGIISDLSAPTANMYGFECRVKSLKGACKDKSCIYPQVCPLLGLTQKPHLDLLQKLRQVPGIRKVFIGSGIRHDLVMADGQYGQEYMHELVEEHVSGQLKLAPEHSEPAVLKLMRKPSSASLLSFKQRFDQISQEAGKNQFLTYYIIAAHPGCTDREMYALREFASEKLGLLPEQVQIFTPTPSTYSSLMYYTEQNPWTGEPVFVEKGLTEKMRQKAIITGWRSTSSSQTEREPVSRTRNAPERGERRGYAQSRGSRADTRTRKPRTRPTGEAEKPQPRVIRDDNGHFFKNERPEGWVDKKEREAEKNRARKPFRPDSPDRTRQERSAPEHRSGTEERPRREDDQKQRPYVKSDDKPYSRYGGSKERGDRPDRSAGRQDKPYKQSSERRGTPAKEGEKPYQHRDRTEKSTERPDNRKPYDRQGSGGKSGQNRTPSSSYRGTRSDQGTRSGRSSKPSGKPYSGKAGAAKDHRYREDSRRTESTGDKKQEG